MLSQRQKEFLFSQFKNPDRALLAEFLAEVGATSTGGYPSQAGALIDGVFFADLLDARDNVSAGQTIFVGEGTYDVNDLLNGLADDVIWDFSPGAVINYTGGAAVNPTNAIFDDTANGAGITTTIAGQGVFNSPDQPVSFNGVLTTSFANTDITFNALSMDSLESCTILLGGGKARINVQGNITSTPTSFGCPLQNFGADLVLVADKIILTGVDGNVLDFSGATRSIIIANEISGDSPSNIINAAGSGDYIVRADIITNVNIAAGARAIQKTGSSNLSVTANLISSLSSGSSVASTDGGELILNFGTLQNIGTGQALEMSGGASASLIANGDLILATEGRAIDLDKNADLTAIFRVGLISGAAPAVSPSAVRIDLLTADSSVTFYNCNIVQSVPGGAPAVVLDSTLDFAAMIDFIGCNITAETTVDVIVQNGGKALFRNTRIVNLDATVTATVLNRIQGVTILHSAELVNPVAATNSIKGAGDVLVYSAVATNGTTGINQRVMSVDVDVLVV